MKAEYLLFLQGSLLSNSEDESSKVISFSLQSFMRHLGSMLAQLAEHRQVKRSLFSQGRCDHGGQHVSACQPADHPRKHVDMHTMSYYDLERHVLYIFQRINFVFRIKKKTISGLFIAMNNSRIFCGKGRIIENTMPCQTCIDASVSRLRP